MPKNNSDKRRTILVARFSALGDVALCIPPLYDSCQEHPDVTFVLLTRPHPATLFINSPDNLMVEGVDLSKYKGFFGLRRLLRDLRRRYFITDFVDLHDVLRTRVLGFWASLMGIRCFRFSKERREKKALTRRHHKLLVPLTPTWERYRRAFHIAGLGAESNFRSIFAELPDINLFSPVTGPKDKDEFWLAIAPFARHKGKIYPYDQMGEVISQIASRPKVKIFVFGFGKEEEAIINRWSLGRNNVINMAKAGLGLPSELALLSYCDVMLSMDSANMHFASLVNLRTVSVWGATHPFTGFMGYRQSLSDVVQLDMTCRPCSVFGNKPCYRGDYHCLGGITPKIIIERILSSSGDSEQTNQ